MQTTYDKLPELSLPNYTFAVKIFARKKLKYFTGCRRLSSNRREVLIVHLTLLYVVSHPIAYSLSKRIKACSQERGSNERCMPTRCHRSQHSTMERVLQP